VGRSDGQRARSVRGPPPEGGAACRVVAGEDDGVEAQPPCDLGQLPVRAGDVNGPDEAGPHAEDRLLPADALHAEPRQRLSAGQRHVGFDKEGVDQFGAAVAEARAELGLAHRLEFEQTDQVRHLGPNEAVDGAARGERQVLQIIVEHIIALRVEIHQPAGDGAVGVGHDVRHGGLGGQGAR